MTTLPPQEIELKLALPREQVDAFLKRMARRRLAAVEADLVTRYFDTPDFALAAAGVALRVRRVGRRWLQTLKTEGERYGGLSRRVEYEVPTARGALDWTRFPPEALTYVPQQLLDRVAPVFETRFHRTSWEVKGPRGALIEVALDVGDVRARDRRQPLCEVELELKAGAADALFALALDWAAAFGCLPFDVSKAERGVWLARGVAAAPVKSVRVALSHDMNVEDGFAAIVQGCLAQFQANLPGVLGAGAAVVAGGVAASRSAGRPQTEPDTIEEDIEYVHQARVALRRLRAALRQFRRVCVLPDDLLADLRALAAALGPARDWDVLVVETLAEIAPHHPDAVVWQRGLAVLEARRAEVWATMRAAIAEARPGVWLLAMQRWLQQHGWRVGAADTQRMAQLARLDTWACRALKQGHRRVVRGARRFAELQPLERHALRITIKRQRYATEFFQPLFSGRRQARYLEVLRAAQDSLGRANDAHVAWTLLETAPPSAAPMTDFVRGWLAARLAGAGNGESAALMETFLDTPTYW
ncbi:MAG: CHAD domain-containing protein [Thiobacillus sp.]